MNECCDKCDRWYCQCASDDEEPIREGTLPKCEACGMFKPGTEEESELEDEETKESRVDEDGSYIPRGDAWYYGTIPPNCDGKSLVKIMANALVKFQQDQKKWVGKAGSFEQIATVMDLWFEHDSNGENKFDHLVPEDDVEAFTKSVIAKAYRI